MYVLFLFLFIEEQKMFHSEHTAKGIFAGETADHVAVQKIPKDCFQLSENLLLDGWPDFSVDRLADWESSARPAPSEPNDCCLVLTCSRVVNLNGLTNGWVCALHETGGIWRERKRVVAKKLKIGRSGIKVIHAISRSMANSNCNAYYALLDQFLNYRNLLNRYGLDCNSNFQSLAEGFYPIDLTSEAVMLLNVIEDRKKTLQCVGDERFSFAIMAPNAADL
jgi:hypothetical protein